MITDFIKKNDVSEELIKEYEDKLPSEMIAFWKEFGFGTFYKGYLKSINPNEYKNLLEKSHLFYPSETLVSSKQNFFFSLLKLLFLHNETVVPYE